MNGETLAEQPPIEQQFNSYLRHYNDTATWLAETLDGSMRTPFEYTFDGRELYASDGSALGDIFLDSVLDAKQLVAKDPTLAFELRRRKLELEEYGDMLRMARGELPNTMVVISDFPPELMHTHEDIGGYNVGRKQTMLRVITWDGRKLTMHSQSLDQSDRRSLEAIYGQFAQQPEAGELLGQRMLVQLSAKDQTYLTDRLTGVYDRSMAEQYGGEWYAGRNESRRDTYQFVLSQHQLLDHFANQFMHRTPSDEDRYNLAALMEKRFEAFKNPAISVAAIEVALNGLSPHDLELQLRQAGSDARAEGKTFSGCGISVGSDPSGKDQLDGAGYGNQSSKDEDKFGPLNFTCPRGHSNRRPRDRLIDSCQKCGTDVSCQPPKGQSKKATLATQKSVFAVKNIDNPPKPIHPEVAPDIGRTVLVAALV